MKVDSRRSVLAWALYDWGNSAFATTVMAGFFPLFFKQYWSEGTDAHTSTFELGLANSLGSLLVALAAPVLGAIADAGRLRKHFLAGFAALGVTATAALYFVGRGEAAWAAALYALGMAGFMGGNVFYDALIVVVAKDERRDFVSALGYALGYLGGGLLFALNVAMALRPAWFGLADATLAVRLSFITVALWWAIFAVPLFVWVREPHRERAGLRETTRAGLRRIADTFRGLRELRVVATFLVAYWLYIDGVDTIIRMAVDYGISLGLESSDLIVALLLTQLIGFPAALVFGKLGGAVGAKRAILGAIGVYVGITIWASQMETEWEFYVLAALVGLVQGGVQALSRSLFARLVPADKATELFGFYNMLGKFAAILGPFLVGTTAALTGNPRASILVVLVLFVGGGALLTRVPTAAGRGARSPAPRPVR